MGYRVQALKDKLVAMFDDADPHKAQFMEQIFSLVKKYEDEPDGKGEAELEQAIINGKVIEKLMERGYQIKNYDPNNQRSFMALVQAAQKVQKPTENVDQEPQKVSRSRRSVETAPLPPLQQATTSEPPAPPKQAVKRRADLPTIGARRRAEATTPIVGTQGDTIIDAMVRVLEKSKSDVAKQMVEKIQQMRVSDQEGLKKLAGQLPTNKDEISPHHVDIVVENLNLTNIGRQGSREIMGLIGQVIDEKSKPMESVVHAPEVSEATGEEVNNYPDFDWTSPDYDGKPLEPTERLSLKQRAASILDQETRSRSSSTFGGSPVAGMDEPRSRSNSTFGGNPVAGMDEPRSRSGSSFGEGVAGFEFDDIQQVPGVVKKLSDIEANVVFEFYKKTAGWNDRTPKGAAQAFYEHLKTVKGAENIDMLIALKSKSPDFAQFNKDYGTSGNLSNQAQKMLQEVLQDPSNEKKKEDFLKTAFKEIMQQTREPLAQFNAAQPQNKAKENRNPQFLETFTRLMQRKPDEKNSDRQSPEISQEETKGRRFRFGRKDTE